ncbi:MAG: DUF4386 family protein [Pseudonocardiaceae bacterium]|nr:DUF4386 family protein [Pseudonocardiaceae bacterium]
MSTRTIGRTVGALFLLAFAVYGAGGALVDSGTAATEVLSGVINHQTQIAAGAMLMLLNSVVVIGIGVLVFPVLKPRHEITAYAYLVTRIVEAVLLAVGTLCLLLLIPLAQAYVDAGASAGSVLPSLAAVAQEGNQYALHIGMIGLGLGGLLFCRALFQARLVPRSLAVLGIVGYPALAAGELLGVLGYDVGLVHYAPGLLFEVALGVLLLVKGFPARQDPRGPASAVFDPRREALHVT